MSKTVTFRHIEHGLDDRRYIIYATLVDAETNQLEVSATLDYCLQKIRERGWILVRSAKTVKNKS